MDADDIFYDEDETNTDVVLVGHTKFGRDIVIERVLGGWKIRVKGSPRQPPMFNGKFLEFDLAMNTVHRYMMEKSHSYRRKVYESGKSN